MPAIEFVPGDATNPIGAGPWIVAHVCNDLGKWGKGFVLAVSRRWPLAKTAYLDWHRQRANSDFALGANQLVAVADGLWVANMIGQHGVARRGSEPPIRYAAISACLAKLAAAALEHSASVHMPRIGCSLAGGTWDEIEPRIQSELVERGVQVVVYDFG